MDVQRPPDVFDREVEWAELARFVGIGAPGALLGLVTGRRRQGKTFLLQALAEEAGGLHHEAVEASATESLRRLAEDYAAYVGSPVPPAFSSWSQVLDALLELGVDTGPTVVVLDEFPLLVAAEPALPSLVQAALSPRRELRRRSSTRLLLCGSALSMMGRLTTADAPLRGRTSLELVVRPMDYREAAAFWGLEQDPWTALRVSAVVGGTPAYRQEFVAYDAPSGPDDFDAWVVRSVLSPDRPLFREGRVLLAEEPDLRETGPYHSILAAVVEGNATRGRIASRVGRSDQALTHPLTVLQDAGLLNRVQDPFRRNRVTYDVTEPLLRFHHAVIRPNLSILATRGQAAAVWRAVQQTFHAQVLGPRFEQLSRSWVARHAPLELLGGFPVHVAPGVLSDPAGRRQHEVDVVAVTRRSDGGPRIGLLGEAKVGSTLGVPHLERLERIREVAGRAGHDVCSTRIALFSAAGFTDELRKREAHGLVTLIGLQELYTGPERGLG